MGWFYVSDNLENQKQRWVGSMHRIIWRMRNKDGLVLCIG